MRNLTVHVELARVIWCHHWTARAPVLPGLVSSDQPLVGGDRQLDLGSSLDGLGQSEEPAQVL
ncbi:hypothetical protein SynBIOSE41_04372 [Synechococcus sp. BIOS-E4-1]|uniref:hypothetical protein n=1 Tax=Synechococcus sp. BIOS-E4-1 TaxID=1400864 RepID=UPI0018628B0D|nr:hypothetical protein [Synechococcus sp. BIOS-E4-1]QNI56822.1 hypothetical protein SynBIOSE41_04372 [Synechococcus sp. BIOS-E4-1]